MNTAKQRKGWLFLPASLLLLLCLLAVGAGSSPSRISVNPTRTPKQKTAGQVRPSVVVGGELKLEILETNNVSNDVFEVTLKNCYTKNITAIAASAGGDQSFRTDYIFAELDAFQTLAPGASDGFLYSPSRLAGTLPQVVVSAVIFSDGTSEGDQREVADIADKRLGVKTQLSRIKPYLDRLGKARDSLVREELQSLRSIAEGLAVGKVGESPMSRGFEHGLRQGRALILHSLSKLETLLDNVTSQSFYANGVLQTTTRSGNENFRAGFPRVEKDFKELASRL